MITLKKVTKGITDVLCVISCVMILGMMLLAVADVVLRVFKVPLIGATEIIQILNVGIVVALGAGTVAKQHVTVDFVMDKFPTVTRFYVQLIVDVVNIVVLILLAVCSFRLMAKSRVQGFTYSLLKIPEWPFVGLIAIGLLGGVVGVICNMCTQIMEHKANKSAEAAGEEGAQ